MRSQNLGGNVVLKGGGGKKGSRGGCICASTGGCLSHENEFIVGWVGQMSCWGGAREKCRYEETKAKCIQGMGWKRDDKRWGLEREQQKKKTSKRLE